MKTLGQHAAAGILLTACLALLIVLASRELRGVFPELPGLQTQTTASGEWLPLDQAEPLFDPSIYRKLIPSPDMAEAFHTPYFQPPEQPKPTPPTTRDLSLLYQGHFITTDGALQAFILVDNKLVTGAPGEEVFGGFHLKAAGIEQAVITNAAGKEFVLPFNQAAPVQAPVGGSK